MSSRRLGPLRTIPDFRIAEKLSFVPTTQQLLRKWE